MSENITLKSLNAASIDALSTMDVINSLQDTDGRVTKNAQINIDGESFNFSVRVTDKGEKLVEVSKNYQKGILGFLQSLVGYRQSVAKTLQNKMVAIFKSNEFNQLTENLNIFRSLVKKNLEQGKTDIEIADYGLSPNRNKVADNRLIQKVQQEFAESSVSIRFNQIDDYNTLCGIEPSSMGILPADIQSNGISGNYDDLMNNIKNGTLKINAHNKPDFRT